MSDLSEIDLFDNDSMEVRHPQAVLLDDFACVRKLHGRILEQDGIHSLRTGSEAEAWKFLGYPEIRLLIQDFERGPGTLGGLEFMKRMNECPVRRHIPVVMISGTGRSRIAQAFTDSFDMPLDEILLLREKPISMIDFQAMSATLHTLIDLRA